MLQVYTYLNINGSNITWLTKNHNMIYLWDKPENRVASCQFIPSHKAMFTFKCMFYKTPQYVNISSILKDRASKKLIVILLSVAGKQFQNSTDSACFEICHLLTLLNRSSSQMFLTMLNLFYIQLCQEKFPPQIGYRCLIF